jgi:hypothetical protein
MVSLLLHGIGDINSLTGDLSVSSWFFSIVYPVVYLFTLVISIQSFLNMSTFLFYKPNSNPGRYSRRERFSLRHTALSDNALNNRLNLSMKKPTYPEPARPSVDNEPDLSSRNLYCSMCA